jgi:hypothetical protein
MANRSNKKRIIKDYENLPEDIVTNIKIQYPRGFAQHLISYINKDGMHVSALPFETEDIYYLVRMTIKEAKQIIEDDEDYDDEGVLRDDFTADSSNENTAFDEEEAFFHNEASTIEYADPDFADPTLKDNIFQGSEFADTDIDSIDFDADDTDTTPDDDDDDDDDKDDDDFNDDDDDEEEEEEEVKPKKKGKK